MFWVSHLFQQLYTYSTSNVLLYASILLYMGTISPDVIFFHQLHNLLPLLPPLHSNPQHQKTKKNKKNPPKLIYQACIILSSCKVHQHLHWPVVKREDIPSRVSTSSPLKPHFRQCLFTALTRSSRVPDQNGVSQAWYIVEIYHSGPKPLSSTQGITYNSLLLV